MPHRRYDDVEFNCFKTGGSVIWSDNLKVFLIEMFGGDCGGGMSDHHDFIILNGDHFDKVSAYLSYELKSSLLLPLHKKDTMEEYETKFKELWESRTFNGSELVDLGIFGHKWHLRTTWILVGVEEGKPSNDYGFKLNILKQGEHEG